MPTHVIAVDGQTADPTTGNVPSVVTVYQLKTILTDAQIKALPTDPVVLVQAPGEGKIIFFHSASFKKPEYAADYTNLSEEGTLNIYYGGNHGINVDEGFVKDGSVPVDTLSDLLTNGLTRTGVFQDGCANTPAGNYGNTARLIHRDVADPGYEDLTSANKALVLAAYNSGGNYTSGDPANTLEVTVFYSIVDL